MNFKERYNKLYADVRIKHKDYNCIHPAFNKDLILEILQLIRNNNDIPNKQSTYTPD